jgi:hypothetical protein
MKDSGDLSPREFSAPGHRALELTPLRLEG